MSLGVGGTRIRGASNVRRERLDAPLAAAAAPPLYSLLATACVAPPVHPSLERIDPVIRMHDYVVALGTLAVLDEPRLGALVVLENSGVDPGVFIEMLVDSVGLRRLRRSIEVISCIAPPRPSMMHYGFSEFQMLDLLMDESSLLTAHFVKITGRYRFPALPTLLDHVPSVPSWLCDSQDIPEMFRRKSSKTIKASMFIASRQFFDERIRGLYHRMHQSPRFSHIENLIYDELRAEHSPRGAVCLRLPINCEPVGVGGNGEALGGLGRRIQSTIRGVARQVVPTIWL